MAALNSSSWIRTNSASCIPPKVRRTSTLLRISAQNSASKARFVAKRCQSISVKQLQRPLIDYMRLPASQYSVLDAERIERVDDNTFRCFVYRVKFFAFEVCPVLVVRVDEEPNGCCIRLLSCKLEGSPIVVAQNDKFSVARLESETLCILWTSQAYLYQLNYALMGDITVTYHSN